MPGFVMMFSLEGSTYLFCILTHEFWTELVLESSLRSERDCVSFTYGVKPVSNVGDTETSSKTTVEEVECVSVHINHTCRLCLSVCPMMSAVLLCAPS